MSALAALKATTPFPCALHCCAPMLGVISDWRHTACPRRSRRIFPSRNGQFILPPSTLLKVIKPQATATTSLMPGIVSADTVASTASPAWSQRDRPDRPVATVSVSQALLAANATRHRQALPLPPRSGSPHPEPNRHHKPAFGDSTQYQRYKITAHVPGLLNVPDRLTLDLTSSPAGLTRQAMLAALVQEDVYLRLARGRRRGRKRAQEPVGCGVQHIALPTLLSALWKTPLRPRSACRTSAWTIRPMHRCRSP